MPQGLIVSEQETSGTSRVFKSVQEILQHYSFALRIPYTSTLPQKVWFHGDINTEEANELLMNEKTGTFLIRFSSKGTFAASFIDTKGLIRHVLINTKGKDCYEVNTGDGEITTFSTIKDMVSYYHEKGIFRYPLKTNQHQSDNF